jgi:prophage maintenance system killer protein
LSQKKTTIIDSPRIDLAIKMIKDGYSDQEIKDVLDLEAAYLSILLKNHKSNQS